MTEIFVKQKIREVRESTHIGEHFLNFIKDNKLICLVDGEHYPPVTKATIEEIEKIGGQVVGLVFLGGTEKVENAVKQLDVKGRYKIYMDKKSTNLPLGTINTAIEETSPDLVIDLSDEPIIDYYDRFRIASILLQKGVKYLGADFIFTPPRNWDILKKPSLAIIGTGKRVGKTAVGVLISRLLKREGFDPVVVCMGRGGPPEPELVDASKLNLTPELLLEVSRKGGHAASDYWEDALLAKVTTVGCRRCGGGMAGNPFASNVLKGAQMTNELPQKLVIMEGSGATFPPVNTDKRIVIIGAGQPLDNVIRLLGEYRIIISDLAIVTMCEEPFANKEKLENLMNGIKNIKPEIMIALTVFRPEPLGNVKGKNCFVATTANKDALSSITNHLEEKYNCNVVGISNNLSNRSLLRKDLKKGLSSSEILLTEIKAASIDVAATTAKEKGCEIVFLHNTPVLIGGTIDNLDEAVLSLCRKII